MNIRIPSTIAILALAIVSCKCLADQQESLRVHSAVPAGSGRLVVASVGSGDKVEPKNVVRRLDPADGFPAAIVKEFAQSANGTIWMATNFGLYSYDGFQVRHFDTGLLTDAVCVCPIVRNGHEEIWLGSDLGLAILSIAKGNIAYVDRFRNVAICCIGIDHVGRPLVGTTDGLFVGTQEEFLKVESSFSECAARSIAADPDNGTTWIGTDQGLCTLQGVLLKRHSLPDVDDLPVYEMHLDRFGALWIGTDRSVLRVKSGNVTKVHGVENPQLDYVRDFTETESELVVWAAKATVRIRSDQLGVDSPHKIVFSRPDRLRSCFVDREGNRWCGLKSRYVVIERSDLQAFSTERCQGVWRQPDSDAIWFSTVSRESARRLVRMQEGLFKSWEMPHNVKNFNWHNGRVLIGTMDGVFQLDGDKVVPHPSPSLQDKVVFDIVVGPNGAMWIATNQGVYKLDENNVTEWLYDEDFRSVRGIAHSPRGVTLAGGGKIRHYDNQQNLLQEIDFAQGNVSRKVVELLRTDDGRLWVGTTCGLFSQQQVGDPLSLMYGKDRRLTSFLIDDDDGHLWAGTRSGVFRINDEAGVQTLLSSELFGPQRIYDCVADGEFTWFAGDEGLFRYRKDSTHPPGLVVDRITSDRELAIDEPVRATTDNKLVAVSFHAITPSMGNGSNLYRYRLRGESEQWSETRKNMVELRDLPAGDYSLELQAFDRNLAASNVVTLPIKVTIPKLRYATYGLLCASLLLSVFAVGYVFRYQRRQNKIMAKQVSKAVGEQLQLEEGLRRAQKLESLGTLASGMAHDFNNALQVIHGCSELAGMVDDRDELLRHLTMIQDTTVQANGLTRSILTLAANQPQQAETVDLGDLTSDCLAMIRQTVPQSIKIEQQRDPQQILVEVEAEQIKQVLFNLFLNARDAMPSGGLLSVSVRALTKNNESLAQIEVRDSGVGIPQDSIERIFEPFYTTKAREKGTGLGLAMAQGIIKGHNGSITVESSEGSGTCFTLSLPRTTTPNGEQARPQKEPIVPRIVAPLKKTVLVAEDQEPVRQVIVRTLEDCGFDVLTADNGARALETASKSRPDILVLDVDMPILDGLTVLREIRNSGNDMPAIVVSGAPVQAKLSSNTVVLLKPFTTEQLREATAFNSETK